MASNNHLNPKQVGRRVRRRRLEVGASQRDIATTGVTYAYISRIEAGVRTPTLSALIVMADQLREYAAAEIARLEELHEADELDYPDDGNLYATRLAELHQIEADTTGLYLLTGSSHDPCPFCGRHEQGDTTTDGKVRGRRRR